MATSFEIVAFDNKISPQGIADPACRSRSIRASASSRRATSSGVANALTEAIDKHNTRNPDSRVLFLNYAAVDPALTNDKCNFWHFRFDANADIKMDALTDVIAKDESIKKVYIIGQDYSFGKAVAAAAVRYLGEKRPDIEIVGNELHPIGKVKDFTPYGRKIVASGADAVITGNWGADMVGLGKSIIENGFTGPIYTYYAAAAGSPQRLAKAAKASCAWSREGQINPPVSDDAADYYTGVQGEVSRMATLTSRASRTRSACWPRRSTRPGTADDVVAVANAL